MNKLSFLERLQTGAVLVSDGATGTNLYERGLEAGKTTEEWILTNPEKVLQLHQEFVQAGSDIILTATFNGTPIRLQMAGLREKAEEINKRAVDLIRQAAEGTNVILGGSIGPTGGMLQPLGTMTEAEAAEAYRDQARYLTEGGVEVLVIETQFDLKEAQIAVREAREVNDGPIVLSFSFDRGTRTMMGVTPEKFGEQFTQTGMVDLLGVNCGKSLDDNLAALKSLRSVTDLPLWFKPNAGLPRLDEHGKTVFDVSPEQIAAHAKQWVEAGASVVGGCCGNTPEHIKQIALAVKSN